MIDENSFDIVNTKVISNFYVQRGFIRQWIGSNFLFFTKFCLFFFTADDENNQSLTESVDEVVRLMQPEESHSIEKQDDRSEDFEVFRF